MRVIKKKSDIKQPFPMRVTCYNCETELEIEEQDTHVGYPGAMYFTCPVCGEESMIDELDGIILTKDNIEFPQHFYYFGNGVDLTSEEIRKYINDAINFFRNNPDNFCYTTGSGNTGILVQNFSGDHEYHVVVTKDFYETEIPYTAKDYDALESVNDRWRNVGIEAWRELRKEHDISRKN